MTDHTYTVAGSTAEFGDTLTGFEELAIAKAFGSPIQPLGDADPMIAVRALVFICRTRDGATVKDAKKTAMDLTRLEVSRYFEFLGVRPGTETDEDPKSEPAG